MMDPLVTIAIPDLGGPAARAATLAALARHTPEPYEVALLVEAPLGRAGSAPPEATVRCRVEVPAPFSTPSALNRLLAMTATPYLLVLESGAIVTSGWLGRLLQPLHEADVGLSGPSTNLSWNEQQVVPGSGPSWSAGRIEGFAAELAAHHGERQVPLDTLHSLGDFCYLFERSVAEQLGGFDEVYGAGPCWEIDFSTRAARAGWRAVWVMGAYVHRAPISPARATSLRRFFTASKQRYQDRFCGLRLQGEKSDYEPHCRGEACEYFAPPGLITITLTRREEARVSGTLADRAENATSPDSLPKQAETAPLPEPAPTHPNPALPRGEAIRSHRPWLAKAEMPLVSCIMPTRNRRGFVGQALAYFARQDYPHRELIVVDDGDDRVADLMPDDPRVRYVALEAPLSIGAKRNRACELARGAIIAHWDDDDWYAPNRLSRQVAPLLADAADVTGLEAGAFFDPYTWQAWTCTAELHRRLFVHDVHGGTLIYWRRVWERMARYPALSLAEDALFLRVAVRRGARLRKLDNDGLFVYVRHATNAWRLSPGSTVDAAGWRALAPDAVIPPGDRPFYVRLHTASTGLHPGEGILDIGARRGSPSPSGSLLQPLRKGGSATSPPDGPLVSCIMPTYNRRPFVPLAIRYFQRQDYPHRELIILDDGDDRVGDLIPADPRIRYVGLDRRMVLGAKRNLACELARGELIAHWDDDDWVAPHRLSYQVEALQRNRADLCSASRQLYFDPAAPGAWLYEYPGSLRRWLAGNVLCYRKAFWERHPFPAIAIGEDTRFAASSAASNTLVLPDHTFAVGLIHAANSSRKVVSGRYWHPRPLEEVYRLLGDDHPLYQSVNRCA